MCPSLSPLPSFPLLILLHPITISRSCRQHRASDGEIGRWTITFLLLLVSAFSQFATCLRREKQNSTPLFSLCSPLIPPRRRLSSIHLNFNMLRTVCDGMDGCGGGYGSESSTGVEVGKGSKSILSFFASSLSPLLYPPSPNWTSFGLCSGCSLILGILSRP